MAIFRRTYSGLITKGLGLPACCGLITMGFGLFKCTIEVIEPHPGGGGGGGGSYPVDPGIYVPWKTKPQSHTKTIQITVKIPSQKNVRIWRRAYTVSSSNADFVVKVMNVINRTTARISVGVNAVKHAARRVVALFSSDK